MHGQQKRIWWLGDLLIAARRLCGEWKVLWSAQGAARWPFGKTASARRQQRQMTKQ
jgi:hypothetical protein